MVFGNLLLKSLKINNSDNLRTKNNNKRRKSTIIQRNKWAFYEMHSKRDRNNFSEGVLRTGLDAYDNSNSSSTTNNTLEIILEAIRQLKETIAR